MMRFKQFLKQRELDKLPTLDGIIVPTEGRAVELYEDRKWITGKFDRNIGIDQPAHGVGQQHAHVYGRKGKEIVVVNLDGSGSHGTKGRLHDQDADALRARGFTIGPDNIVEWITLKEQPEVLLG